MTLDQIQDLGKTIFETSQYKQLNPSGRTGRGSNHDAAAIAKQIDDLGADVARLAAEAQRSRCERS